MNRNLLTKGRGLDMFTRQKFLFKIISISLIVLLMIVTTASASTLTIDTENGEALFEQMIPAEVQRAMEAQEPALNAYMKLSESFEKNEFGIPVYPEGYAGEYIDENNQLVVLVVSQPSFQKTKHFDSIQADKNVVIKEVKYSYNYLSSLKSVADKLYEEGIRVVTDGIDVRNNEYRISILVDDYKKLSESDYLKKASFDLPIRFEEDEGATACANLWGGERIFNDDSGGYMSIGIGGEYNGGDAIVTCGHGNEKVGILFPRYPYISNFEHRIGQVAYQQANTDSSNYGVTALGDFAIVPLDSDIATNWVHPGVQITGTYSSVPVGTTVYKYGTTTGYSWGTVEQASIRVTYSDGLLTTYHVSGLYQMNMTNDSGTDAIGQGDSGGPVWRKDGSADKLHGIVTAGNMSHSPKRIMYTTPIYYVEYNGFTTKTN